jgi:hypothetical protein
LILSSQKRALAPLRLEQLPTARIADALTKILRNTAACAYGHDQPLVPISNYGYFKMKTPCPDINGWMRNPPGATAGGWSAPVWYDWSKEGQRYINSPTGEWDVFCDNMRTLVSCRLVENEVVLWTSFPSYGSGDKWLWERGVQHAKALKVRIFHWNPPELTPPGDDDFAAQAFAVPVKHVAPASVKVTADSVSCGSIVTTRAEWEKVRAG